MAATTPSKKQSSSKKNLVPDVEYAENIAIAKTINTQKTFDGYLLRYRDKMLFSENGTPEDAMIKYTTHVNAQKTINLLTNTVGETRDGKISDVLIRYRIIGTMLEKDVDVIEDALKACVGGTRVLLKETDLKMLLVVHDITTFRSFFCLPYATFKPVGPNKPLNKDPDIAWAEMVVLSSHDVMRAVVSMHLMLHPGPDPKARFAEEISKIKRHSKNNTLPPYLEVAPDISYPVCDGLYFFPESIEALQLKVTDCLVPPGPRQRSRSGSKKKAPPKTLDDGDEDDGDEDEDDSSEDIYDLSTTDEFSATATGGSGKRVSIVTPPAVPVAKRQKVAQSKTPQGNGEIAGPKLGKKAPNVAKLPVYEDDDDEGEDDTASTSSDTLVDDEDDAGGVADLVMEGVVKVQSIFEQFTDVVNMRKHLSAKFVAELPQVAKDCMGPEIKPGWLTDPEYVVSNGGKNLALDIKTQLAPITGDLLLPLTTWGKLACVHQDGNEFLQRQVEGANNILRKPASELGGTILAPKSAVQIPAAQANWYTTIMLATSAATNETVQTVSDLLSEQAETVSAVFVDIDAACVRQKKRIAALQKKAKHAEALAARANELAARRAEEIAALEAERDKLAEECKQSDARTIEAESEYATIRKKLKSTKAELLSSMDATRALEMRINTFEEMARENAKKPSHFSGYADVM